MKKNIITAVGLTGIYKDKEIEVEIGKDGSSSKIKINGKELTNVIGVHIHLWPDKPTKLVLEIYKK